MILVILNKFYIDNSKLYSKLLVHLIGALVLVDVLWLIIIVPFWKSETKVKNIYWESLSGIHTFAIFISFLEILNKGAMLFVILNDFNKRFNGQLTEMLKFNYSEAAPLSSNNNNNNQRK